jgi:hypothetical protein
MKGLITRTLEWIEHPQYSDASLQTWAAGLVLILIVSFLWSRVVTQISA